MKLPCLIFAGTLAGCASQLSPPKVSEPLRAPAGELLQMRAHASGVQIYECKMTVETSRWEWVLRGPEAELRDDGGHVIGRHYAGPTWESSDGSKVVATLVRRLPAADTSAVPWLLLRAQKNEGEGALGHTTWIQRVETHGGLAPGSGCDGEQAGASTRVPYRATYYFYGQAQ
jgi:hypothetical protein